MVRRDPLLATIVVSAGGSAVCVLSGLVANVASQY